MAKIHYKVDRYTVVVTDENELQDYATGGIWASAPDIGTVDKVEPGAMGGYSLEVIATSGNRYMFQIYCGSGSPRTEIADATGLSGKRFSFTIYGH